MRKLIIRIGLFVVTTIILTFWFAWCQPVEENEYSGKLVKKFSEAAVKSKVISSNNVAMSYETKRFCTLFYWQTFIHIAGNVSEKQKADLRKIAASIEKETRQEDGDVQHIKLIFESPRSYDYRLERPVLHEAFLNYDLSNYSNQKRGE